MINTTGRPCYRGSAHPAHEWVSNVYPHKGFTCPGRDVEPDPHHDRKDAMTTELVIQRATILTGHISPETAYVVDDYPYGRLRCTIRYWIETGQVGVKKGERRLMSQTTNPKRGGWNKPKAGTYSQLMVMYLDEKGHVQPHGIPLWIGGAEDARARLMGVYDALSEGDRKQYDALVAYSRKHNPRSWAEWDERVTLLAAAIASGEELVIENSVWHGPGGRLCYLTDPAAYVTTARARVSAP